MAGRKSNHKGANVRKKMILLGLMMILSIQGCATTDTQNEASVTNATQEEHAGEPSEQGNLVREIAEGIKRFDAWVQEHLW
jgi:Flp pilus assembly protein TadD